MSKVSSLVVGLVSGAAMFGAIQYASGNDLSGSSLRGTLTERDTAISPAAFAPASPAVNRTAKGDRDSTPAKLDPGQTLSFQVHGLSDTSVLLRLAGSAPKAQQDKPASTKAIPIDTRPRKATVACEPPVSMLTEVARSLQPGRCVT